MKTNLTRPEPAAPSGAPTPRKRILRKLTALALDQEVALNRPLGPLAVGCAEDPIKLWRQIRHLERIGGALPATSLARGTRALQKHFLFSPASVALAWPGESE